MAEAKDTAHKKTAPLEITIGSVITDLESTARAIYGGTKTGIEPGLDIRQLPEYVDAICSLAKLRDAVAKKYIEQNR